MSRKSRGQRARERPCRTCWGSHGCRRQAGHTGPHWCSSGCPVVPVNVVVNEHNMAVRDYEKNEWVLADV